MNTCVEVCWALCAMHQLCMCTTPQEKLFCMVYSVFRRPLPCNPSTAHNMCISHRRLRNTTLLFACTGHQIRASQCNPHCTPVAQTSMYFLCLTQTRHEHIHRGGLGSVCNALTLYVYFMSGTLFLYGVLRVQVSTAMQPVHSIQHAHCYSPFTQHYPTICLYRPPNTSIIMHTPLHFRCTGLCIHTCALCQTPHEHMRRGALGSVCNALTLYVYFASGTPFLYGVLHVQAFTAVQPVRSTHVHFSSPLMQYFPTFCLYRPPNTSIAMHTSLYSRCTGVCIYTCALCQILHGHMRRGVLGSGCNT